MHKCDSNGSTSLFTCLLKKSSPPQETINNVANAPSGLNIKTITNSIPTINKHILIIKNNSFIAILTVKKYLLLFLQYLLLFFLFVCGIVVTIYISALLYNILCPIKRTRERTFVFADFISVCDITYAPSAEEPYSQNIFNMSRASEEYAKIFRAKHAIQDYVFTDGSATYNIERRFAEDLDVADEVIVYAKLPKGSRGFYIPAPVGNYSPDWTISFKKGVAKHIFFIAETKGTMDNREIRPIEQAKISCPRSSLMKFLQLALSIMMWIVIRVCLW